MKFIGQMLFAMLLCATALAHSVSVTQETKIEDKPAGKTITVCRPELTALGKAAYFHLNFQYLVKTDAGGAVEKITKILGEKYAKFVQEDKLIKCMETWKLKPSTEYIVTISVGTTSRERSISISEKGGERIKLIL